MVQASISSIVDRSTSMSSYGYLEPAKTDAATFITNMHSGDQIGVVALDSSSPVLYNLTSLQADHSAANAAINAITAISAQGSTNMKAAIANAHSMLASAANPAKAVILLSDGEWNTGGDPLPTLPTDIPFYTIALGQSSGIATLQTIATRTSGKYYYSPDAFDLAAIYNQITNDAQVAQANLNEKRNTPSYHYNSYPLSVPAGTSHVSVATNWLNTDIDYTSGTPGANQMTVMLRDPDGNKVDPSPTFLDEQFVTFHLHDPAAGTWTVGNWCGDVPSNQFQNTMGGFEADSHLALRLDAPEYAVPRGQPFTPELRLETDGREIDRLSIRAHLDSPRYSRAELLERHARELETIRPDAAGDEEQADEEGLRLQALRRKMLPDEDIFARRQTPIDWQVAIDADDGPRLSLAPVSGDTPGEHNLVLQVDGRLASCGSHFSRVQRVGFSVTG